MRGMRRIALLLALLVALVPLGCGGSDDEAASGKQGAQPRTETPPSVLARANANCRYFLRETRKLGKQAFRGSSDIEELTTERLVKPSIPLLERVARRQQALARAAHDRHLTLYASLFDPIIVLARERLRSGRAVLRSGDVQEKQRSEELEDAMTDLGLEQKTVAEDANLPACSVDFREALLSSLSG